MLRLVIFLLFTVTHVVSVAQGARKNKPKFVPPARGEVYLLTAGLGKDIYARYGHSTLRIIDLDSGADYNFNWGIFDYTDPVAFGFVFFKGILTYKLAISGWGAVRRNYTRQKRWLVQNKINLTEQQKQNLYALLVTNLQPENITYHYQYFYNNCATIIRDYLDLILHTRLKEKTQNAKIEETFRFYVRENLNRPPAIAFSLDLIMNSRIDIQLSKWHEMFYPLKLQEHLAQLQAVDDNGNLTSKPLLEKDKQLLAGQEFPSSSHVLGNYIPSVIIVLLLITWMLYLRHKQHFLRWLVALLLLLGGVFSGAFGLIMLVSWLHSEHFDLHHNLNLLQFWATDLLVLPCMGVVLLLQKDNAIAQRLHKALRYYSFAHLLCYLLLLLLALAYLVVDTSMQLHVPVISQNVFRSLYVGAFLPLCYLYFLRRALPLRASPLPHPLQG